jgi:hypothetical protein
MDMVQFKFYYLTDGGIEVVNRTIRTRAQEKTQVENTSKDKHQK